jgi:all-trans-8'-apo-beta-carotenal 15,15'-oxygenase
VSHYPSCVIAHHHLQEPYFIPRRDAASEDDGWIIAGIHNAETQHGEIVILDAQR